MDQSIGMEQPSFNEVTDAFSSKGVEVLKLTIKDAWDSLTADERTQVLHLMALLVKAHLLELLGRDVSHYLPILEAAFANWKVVGKQVVTSGIQNAFTTMFGFAGTFAGGVIAGFVKSIV